MLITVAAIGVGAALGALMRFALSATMNAMLPALPLGTLAANLIAAYVVGAAIAFFGADPDISPAWRLFIITGFAGGLSTFSSFSAELLFLLRDGRMGWSMGAIALHVGGSLLMTVLGMASVSLAHRSG
ncbi:MAG: fluoride efflux transporter CrcB [Gammaproteobacteria bacterium]|nr:fluoride efflux transporter CrcB [Gammaproteobacteria bacterium]MBU1444162.1 fluoride efflux transporter CrcB [Gammaproteobacteria bacterium]MBU2287439.1 fluoride efflux transporter CrcB [Gammaproteobacteria bacterium]MBU2407170.1 fluoride efflux transporter CrcB [Gammaproteobacteria bacterium]